MQCVVSVVNGQLLKLYITECTSGSKCWEFDQSDNAISHTSLHKSKNLKIPRHSNEYLGITTHITTLTQFDYFSLYEKSK